MKNILFVALFVFLTTTNSLAGEVYVNCGTANGTINIDVSNPGTDSEVTCTAPGGRHAIEYKVKSQALIPGNILKVKFSGTAFNGGQVTACSNTNPPTTLSTAIPSAGTTTYYFLINANVPIDEYIYLTGNACDGAAGRSINLLKQLNNIPGGANVTISALSSGNIPLDVSGNAQVFTLVGACDTKNYYPTVHSFDHQGGTKTFNIASSGTSAGYTTQCLWYASKVEERYWDSAAKSYAYRNADWVTVNNWSGVGSGTISYNVAPFNNIGSRLARIVLFGNKNFYITQIGLAQSGLTVTKTGTGMGNVTVNTGNISWNGNVGTAEYPQGTTITLTATATGNSTFWGWSGDCSGSANTCTLTIDTSKTVNAIFFSPSSTCNYKIEPVSKSFGKAAGTGKFSILAPTDSECTNKEEEWTVVSDATDKWVQFAYECNQNICYSNSFTGKGSGVVAYKVLQNQAGTSRTAHVSSSVTPLTYIIQQSGSSCRDCGFNFNDVPSTHWAKDYINAIACAGITVGCSSGYFCPNDYVTNAQLTAFISRAREGEPPDQYCNNGGGWFLDNPIGNVFCNYIRRLAELEIIGECTNGYFCPNNLVIRSTVAESMIKALREVVSDNYCINGSPFSDVSINHPKCKYIKKLYDLGIATGCGGGKFCPNDFITRAELSTFLYRAFLKQHCD